VTIFKEVFKSQQAWFPSCGNYGLEPGWLPFWSTACFTYFLVPETAKTRSKSSSCWPPFAVNITISFCYNWLLLSCTFHCCRLPWPWDARLLQVEDNTEKLRQLSLLEVQVAHFLQVCAPSRPQASSLSSGPSWGPFPNFWTLKTGSKVVRLTVTSVSELRDRLETRFRRLSIDSDAVTLRIDRSTVDQVFRSSFIDFERKLIAQHFFKAKPSFSAVFRPKPRLRGLWNR